MGIEPGLLGEEQECYLCAMKPLAEPLVAPKSSLSVAGKNTISTSVGHGGFSKKVICQRCQRGFTDDTSSSGGVAVSRAGVAAPGRAAMIAIGTFLDPSN